MGSWKSALILIGVAVAAGAAAAGDSPPDAQGRALAVLRAPDVPSVLFESGFVTNQLDFARLTTPQGQGQMAGVLAQAIRVYFARANADGAAGE